MKFDFDVCVIGLTMLICCVFAAFVTYDNEQQTKRQYYLQTIDDDGTQWFVHMTPSDHEKWAAKRYAKLKAETILGK